MKTAKLLVTWNLDPVPGWNDKPDDLRRLVEKYLRDTVPHYEPEVEVIR